MSTSIGIGISQVSGRGLESDVLDVAAMHNYGIGCGLNSFENDVREGIENLAMIRDWDAVFSLRAPKDALANLAFGVYEELRKFECNGAEPNFFAFCRDLVRIASEQDLLRIGIFFASEWYKDDRIRFACGNIDDLISALSVPGSWMLNVLNPVTGRVEEWDEMPYFFELATKLTR